MAPLAAVVLRLLLHNRIKQQGSESGPSGHPIAGKVCEVRGEDLQDIEILVTSCLGGLGRPR